MKVLNVFYLDDEPQLCEIFAEYFSSPSVHVSTFTDADSAIKQCALSPPDLFFIDFRLDNTNGEAVARATSEDIPKVLVSGDLMIESDYPFLAIIGKPYDFDRIQQIIEQLS